MNKELLKNILRELVTQEQDKLSIKQDIKDLKWEFNKYIPQKYVSKILQIYLKGYDPNKAANLEFCSDILGIPAMCEIHQPSGGSYENRDQIMELCKRHRGLREQLELFSDDQKDTYNKAKALGFSVPLLKKAVDLITHPQKLELYFETNPLLESYIEAGQDTD